MKVLCAPMKIALGHPEKNATNALLLLNSNKTYEYVVFPPLFLTGCTCAGLFDFSFFIKEQSKQLSRIIADMPDNIKCVSSIMEDGEEIPIIFDSNGIMKISEGINVALDVNDIKKDRVNFLCQKHVWRIGSIDELVYSLKGTNTYFTCSGKGESSARDVYSGACGGVSGELVTLRQFENAEIDSGKGYEELIQKPDIYPNPTYPFVPAKAKYLDEAIDILSSALRRRLDHMTSDKVVIGVSGGLDSTLALLIAHNVIGDKKNIVGITMPGLGTSTETKTNANRLMAGLNITSKTIDITDAVLQHFKDIDQDENVHDITYENAQARERMQILFDYSNKIGAINLGTGDLSEAMLGFTTFGGDHLSMYNLNIGVPKTLVRALVLRFAQRMKDISHILMSIATGPISPELIPGKQDTESIVGSYQANDFAIFHTVVGHMSRNELENLLSMVDLHLNLDDFYRRITSAQFKRNCSADGVGVTRCTIGPGGDFTIPSDCKNVF